MSNESFDEVSVWPNDLPDKDNVTSTASYIFVIGGNKPVSVGIQV